MTRERRDTALGSPAAAALLDDDSRKSALLIEFHDVTKTYGAVQALRGVDFDLRAGEVHALLGQNGAGKSTLIKILAGVTPKTSGRLLVEGRETEFASPADAQDAGLAIVYQELSLVPSMTVAANMFLGREPRNAAGLVNRRALLQQARETLVKHGLPLDPQRLVSSLPFAYRQLTEIAKALVGNARILVLDEPTSSLTGGEEEVLFAAIKNATERGVGVIYVTHRLAEVFQITDRVTVFRDGQRVVTQDTKATDMAGLVAAIVGPGHERMKRATMAVETGTAVAAPGVGMPDEPPSTGPVMEMVGVSNDRLTDIELTVGAGEIVGLAGNISSGRTEILETLFGLRPAIKDTLRLDGHELTLRRPEDAIRRGIALAPEDRHLSGLVLDHSIEHNVAMPRLPQLTKLGLFQRKAATARAEAAVTELAIKTPTVQTRLRDLSGGNQQKVVFGKWRGPAPRVLLLDEPTVGVDVGAREEIYDVIRRMASQGCAVVVASSDFDELLQLAHRVAIVIDGRITEAMPRTAITSEQHLHHLVQENKS